MPSGHKQRANEPSHPTSKRLNLYPNLLMPNPLNPKADSLWRFRHDIEGMRAVAIFPVIAAHAGMYGVAGGYVGVDVFFVISGYLITGLLVREIESRGRIAFTEFYARRILRLMPALLVMLCATGLAAKLLLPVSSQPDLAISAATAGAWVSNFHFAFSRVGYFQPAADSNPFLHTWSLGVEEQFYLLWPALITAAIIGAAVFLPRIGSRIRLAMLLSLVLAASLFACLWWTASAPIMAFYMMPSRAWQFALGGIVFLSLDPARTHSSFLDAFLAKPIFRNIVGWLGLAGILCAAVIYDEQVPYPGVRALLPSLGTAGLLAAGLNQHGPLSASRLLSTAPFQLLGRISYSWYLWHWPVLIIGNAVIASHTGMSRLGLVVFSLLISIASYRWVESPLRHARWLRARPRWVLAGAVALAVLLASGALRWASSAIDISRSPEFQSLQAVRGDAPVIYGMDCDRWFHDAELHPCQFGPADAPKTAVIMGDSIGLQWFPAYIKTFEAPLWRVLVLTKSSCPMVDAPFFYARIKREYTECAIWRTAAIEYAASLKADLIVMGSGQSYGFDEATWTEGTVRVLQRLATPTTHVAIMEPTAVLPFNGPDCLTPRSAVYEKLVAGSRCEVRLDKINTPLITRSLSAAALRVPNVSFISTNDLVCADEVCSARRGELIVYRDAQHLTASFAEYLQAALSRRLLDALPDSDR
jgi:peptidoglycan/LPS O-acetylase OafA/YrhL